MRALLDIIFGGTLTWVIVTTWRHRHDADLVDHVRARRMHRDLETERNWREALKRIRER